MALFCNLLLSLVVLTGSVRCQNLDPSHSELEEKLKESGLDIPNNLNMNSEKLETLFREKCEKRNATDAVESLKAQKDTIQNCVSTYIDQELLKQELEEAKKTGSMDEVFKKYCDQWPEVYGCFDNASITVRTCMTKSEIESFNKTLSIVQEMQKYACEKDGDRLALFVAEGGVDCLNQKQEGIKLCLNTTLSKRIPDETDITDSLTFLFEENNCEDFDEVKNCIKHTLEQCSDDTTPANIVDSTFSFIRKHLTCDSEPITPKPSVSVQSTSASGNVLMSTLLFVTYFSFFFI